MKKVKFPFLASFLMLSYFISAQETESKKNLFTKFAQQKQSSNLSQSKTTASFAPGRSVNYFWDAGVNDWDLVDTTFYSYNAQGLLSEELRQQGASKNRKLYTYDGKQRLTQELYQYYTSYWVNSSINITVYDQNDNRVENSYSTYNTMTNQWEINGGFKNIITYNSNNKIVSNVSQDWNASLDIWQDTYKYTNYIYNSNGMATQYDTQTKNGNLWENESRVKSTYSIFNQLIELQVDSWNGSAFVKDERFTNIAWHTWSGSTETGEVSSFTTQVWGTPLANQWNTDTRYTVTFDVYGGSVALGQNYVNSTWENDYRYTDSYDSRSNQSGFRSESWLNSSWTIDSEEKINHIYDFAGNIVQSEWQNWDYINSTLKNYQKKVYSDFKLISGINSPSNSLTSEISVFPNPFNSSCTLRIDKPILSNETNLTFQVYDLFGKVVSQSQISGQETQIQRGNLAQGIYFYSVMDKSNILTKGKLVVE